eukprot:scaffold36501_cov197-Skeletonema_marinoi.AAC.1
MIGNVHDVPIILGSRSDIETEKERKMSETNLHLLKVRRGPNPNNAIASLPISSTIDQSSKEAERS